MAYAGCLLNCHKGINLGGLLFHFQMTRDNFHCPRFVDSFDSLRRGRWNMITEDQLAPNCVFSLPVATSVILPHFVHVLQLLHSQLSVCTKMQAIEEDISDSYFQYIKFFSGTPHKCLWTVHTQMLNGVNMMAWCFCLLCPQLGLIRHLYHA